MIIAHLLMIFTKGIDYRPFASFSLSHVSVIIISCPIRAKVVILIYYQLTRPWSNYSTVNLDILQLWWWGKRQTNAIVNEDIVMLHNNFHGKEPTRKQRETFELTSTDIEHK